MDLLQQSAQAWKEITEYRYLFTYGYKKQLYPINLTFSLEDYPHLAGFQYMKDISLPNYSSSKIADRILEGKILFEKVQKAAQYEEMIKPRLEALVHLKESLDNKFNLYSYMPRMYPFITGIKADYLISSHFSVDNFIFIIKANAQGELKCDFLCCSIFEKGDRDYETNQKARTLMKKEYIFLLTPPIFYWIAYQLKQGQKTKLLILQIIQKQNPIFHNSTTFFGRWFFSAIPPIQFCDCTRKTHPPFYGEPVYRDFDTPYRSCQRSPRFA